LRDRLDRRKQIVAHQNLHRQRLPIDDRFDIQQMPVARRLERFDWMRLSVFVDGIDIEKHSVRMNRPDVPRRLLISAVEMRVQQNRRSNKQQCMRFHRFLHALTFPVSPCSAKYIRESLSTHPASTSPSALPA